MSSGLSKMLPTNYSFINYIFNMYKQNLALNNLLGLLCHKNQHNKYKTINFITTKEFGACKCRFTNKNIFVVVG